MPTDPTAKPEPTCWTCANCEVQFSWAPVVFLGLPFCCSGCAAGGPCTCSYEDAPRRSSSGAGASHLFPEAAPRPPVPMTAAVRDRLAREVEGLSAVVGGRIPRRRSRLAAERSVLTDAGAASEVLATRVERLLALEDLLSRARVSELRGQAVVGSWVKVYDGEDRILTYHIVLPQDADPGSGRIAPDSPLGRALLGAQVGDPVEVLMSGTLRTLLVVDVRYPDVHYPEETAREQATSRPTAAPRGAADGVLSLPPRG